MLQNTKPRLRALAAVGELHHRDKSVHYINLSATDRKLSLMDLPAELHILISKELIYPDALSLKHTSRHFYDLVYTGVKLKVSWLVQRRKLHLECPNNARCDLGSDLRFCRGSVRLLMQRRREHLECGTRPGVGCLVLGTPVCTHNQQSLHRIRRWLKARLRLNTIELQWLLIAAVLLLICWFWFPELSKVLMPLN